MAATAERVTSRKTATKRASRSLNNNGQSHLMAPTTQSHSSKRKHQSAAELERELLRATKIGNFDNTFDLMEIEKSLSTVPMNEAGCL